MAQDTFNPYVAWLELAGDQPTDHYALLGLTQFEPDQQQIQIAFERRYALVRRYQIGPYEADAHRLLDELTAAFSTLSDPPTRRVYDEQLTLRRPVAASDASDNAGPPALSPIYGTAATGEAPPIAWSDDAAWRIILAKRLAEHAATSDVSPDALHRFAEAEQRAWNGLYSERRRRAHRARAAARAAAWQLSLLYYLARTSLAARRIADAAIGRGLATVVCLSVLTVFMILLSLRWDLAIYQYLMVLAVGYLLALPCLAVAFGFPTDALLQLLVAASHRHRGRFIAKRQRADQALRQIERDWLELSEIIWDYVRQQQANPSPKT